MSPTNLMEKEVSMFYENFEIDFKSIFMQKEESIEKPLPREVRNFFKPIHIKILHTHPHG